MNEMELIELGKASEETKEPGQKVEPDEINGLEFD